MSEIKTTNEISKIKFSQMIDEDHLMLNEDYFLFFLDGICSNWYPAEFKYKTIKFENSEQAFMLQKAARFNDMAAYNKIIAERNPEKCKAIGREIENFYAEDWMRDSPGIMYEINYCKFRQNEELLKSLLETSPKILVEASHEDRIWGIGYSESDARITPRKKWGKNLLGKVLVQVREDLKAEIGYRTEEQEERHKKHWYNKHVFGRGLL